MSIYRAVFGTTLMLMGSYAAAETCQATNVDSILKPSDYRIAKIRINAGDLFDSENPDQRRRVHRIANGLHLKTLERTVEAALPFKVGDVYSSDVLAEGERILRNKRYIRDAIVTPVRFCGSGVEIHVRTIDNWTLTPSVNFGRAGGDSTYSIELQDLNFLGTGKELKLVDRRSGDLRKSTFIYGDDNILGGRHRVRLEMGDNDDGELFAIETGLPFYAESSMHSWWLNASSISLSYDSDDQAETTIPVLSDIVDIRYNQRINRKKSKGLIWGAGLRYARQITKPDLHDVDAMFVTDFHEIYPFIETHLFQRNWIKKQNYDNIRANEDIDIGFSLRSEAGFIFDGIGENQRNGLRLNTGITKGWQLSDLAFHKIDADTTLYFNNPDQKYLLSARYQYFRWLTQRDQLNIRFTSEQIKSYSPIHNRIIGGENGLKAYPNKYQQGENRVVGLLEYRRVMDWSPYSLANTAISVFAESGRAWNAGDDNKALANVGIGFLLSPTRSSTAAINRFEIAVPLVRGEGVSDFQLFIGTKINY